MKPIEFREQNVVFAKNQLEYKPLPALHLHDADGTVISCWGLSFRERIRVLFTGKIWVGLLSFGKPLTPSRLTVKKTDLI